MRRRTNHHAGEVKSPDLKKLPYSLHDPKSKCTVYFATAERKARYIERMAARRDDASITSVETGFND